MSLITSSAAPQAAAAYQAMAKRMLGIPTTAEPASAMPRFENFLRAELGSATNDLKASETQSIKAVSGKADIQQVVEAVTTAELSLQKVTAIRDRVISAYQDIMRMPI